MTDEDIENLVRIALDEGRQALREGNRPFGAVLVSADGHVLARGHNTEIAALDPVGHAEVNVLRKAAQAMGTIRFDGCILVGNAEPCSMCASLCIKRGVRTFFYGTSAEDSMEPWLPIEVVAAAARKAPVTHRSGFLLDQCSALLQEGKTARGY